MTEKGKYGLIHTATYLGAYDYKRGMDWWIDLLTTYIHHSELHFKVQSYTNTSVLCYSLQ
jgi:hypothetical protein